MTDDQNEKEWGLAYLIVVGFVVVSVAITFGIHVIFTAACK